MICVLFAISPPKHAENMPRGCWIYMILPGSLASAKWTGGFGLFLSAAGSILTVLAGPMMLAEEILEACRVGENIKMPSRYPPNGYLSFTNASPIYKCIVRSDRIETATDLYTSQEPKGFKALIRSTTAVRPAIVSDSLHTDKETTLERAVEKVARMP